MSTRLPLAALVFAFAVPARAADPCGADKKKFCAGSANVMDCMLQHGSELSQACQQAYMSGKLGDGGGDEAPPPPTKRKKAAPGEKALSTRACLPDLNKFCAKVKPGDGRLVECLHANEAKLSKPCKKAHSEHYRKIEMAPNGKASCAEDAENLCAEVAPGTGRLARCLKEHLSELSKPCTRVVKGGRDRLESQMAAQLGVEEAD
ncbi:hypothetical protein EPO15_06320 [bacterium]|nr:MAG: hypothetical protein EPO15_06320 [bacterium]